MKLSTAEQAMNKEIKANFAHLLGEEIAEGWTFLGAEVVRTDESDAYYKHPNLLLNVTLSHELYSGLGELEELAHVAPIMEAIIYGFSVEEAQERFAEIEQDVEDGKEPEGANPLYNISDMPFYLNYGRYDYK